MGGARSTLANVLAASLSASAACRSVCAAKGHCVCPKGFQQTVQGSSVQSGALDTAPTNNAVQSRKGILCHLLLLLLLLQCRRLAAKGLPRNGGKRARPRRVEGRRCALRRTPLLRRQRPRPGSRGKAGPARAAAGAVAWAWPERRRRLHDRTEASVYIVRSATLRTAAGFSAIKAVASRGGCMLRDSLNYEAFPTFTV
jgi:hypothetical protein